MIALLDVNVLIALAWPNHVHHEAAHRWFRTQQPTGWATTAVTQSGFVRISSNPKVFQQARTPTQALALLGQITGLPGHEFWEDRTDLCHSPHLAASRIIRYDQVTDAHLLAIALDHGGILATFDRGIPGLAPTPRRNRIVVIGDEKMPDIPRS